MQKKTGSIEKKLGQHGRAQSLHFPQPGRSLIAAENEHQGRELSSKSLVTEQGILNTGHSSLKICQSKKNLLY